MNALQRLQNLLRVYSLTRISNKTGISRITLMRIRDGESSPTFDMHERILDVVFADAIEASDIRRGKAPSAASASAAN